MLSKEKHSYEMRLVAVARSLMKDSPVRFHLSHDDLLYILPLRGVEGINILSRQGLKLPNAPTLPTTLLPAFLPAHMLLITGSIARYRLAVQPERGHPQGILSASPLARYRAPHPQRYVL